MAKYNFNDLFDLNSFKKGFDFIEKRAKEANEAITGKETTRKGNGKQLLEETKQVEKLIEAEKKLIEAEKERKNIEKEMIDAKKKAAKEEQEIIKTRIKAEQDAEKFLKQFNAEEIKRNEQLKLRKKELRDNAKAELDLEKIQKKEVKTLKDLQDVNNALIRVRNGLDKTTIQGRKRFDELTTTIERNNRTLLNNDKNIGIFRRNVGNYVSGFKSMISSIGGLSGVLRFTGITLGITSMINAFKNAINIYKNFEKSASTLAAILGESKNNIVALTNQAKELGSTTAFTASEILALQTELAKLGFNITQIEASTEGILDLAAATGNDLANSAEIAGATLRIFNLDASEMSRVTDVLAKSTTISSLSMEKLSTIMPIVGKTAQLAGVSLERTAALAGTLTDRGIDASSAATSLRNIFIELSAKGITWDQAMTKINSSTDKVKTSTELFGKRAGAAGVILAETGDSVDKLTTALEGADGAAKEMADTMLNNLSGDITKAKSAWEGFILSVESGEGIFSRVARNITQAIEKFLTSMRRYNEGIGFQEQILLENEKVQKKIEYSLKRQEESINKITDSEERKQKAIEKTKFIQEQIIKFETQLRKEQQKNVFQLDKEAIIALRVKILEYKALEKGLKKYTGIQEVATKNEQENNNAITENNKSRKKSIDLYRDEEALIKEITDFEIESIELSGRKRVAEEARLREELTRNQLRVSQLLADENYKYQRIQQLEEEHQRKLAEIKKKYDIEYAEFKKNKEFDVAKEAQKITDKLTKDDNKRKKEEIEARIKADEEAAKFYNELWTNTLNKTDQLAGSISQGRYQSEVNAIQNQANFQNEVLERQLANGEISEQLYRQKKEELAKETSRKQAEAEQDRVLYEIKINTALAAIKAAPNPLAIAGALALGAAQYAFVKAFGLPAFKDGKINIQGEGTETSDSILARISKGESVIKAKATKKSSKLLQLVNDEVITDRNATELLSNYTVNQLENRFMKSIESNTRETNKIIGRIGNVMQRKDGSYFIILANGKTENISLNG